MLMESFLNGLKEQFTSNTLLSSIAVILFNFAVYTAISRVIRNKRKNQNHKLAIGSKGRTYMNLLVSVLRYVMLLMTILIVLEINHVDVSTILASVGIISAIVGLALQDALKDIIRGVALISDSYFQVGDYVFLDNGVEGRVSVIGLKTTRVVSAADGTTVSIANRNIEKVRVAGDHFMFNIPLPYGLKVSRAEEVIAEIIEQTKQLDSVVDCKYLGVQELGDSFVSYRVRINQVMGKKMQAKRGFNKIILQTLERHRIAIPYRQLDIHSK